MSDTGWGQGPGPGAPPEPAATVVPLRDGPAGLEVLMLRRSGRGAFGGMWVFPGGKVESEDRSGPSTGGGASPGPGARSPLAAG
jgi:8-oxo-dGTP pyrophosphatase MutT (NUDIX family)